MTDPVVVHLDADDAELAGVWLVRSSEKIRDSLRLEVEDGVDPEQAERDAVTLLFVGRAMLIAAKVQAQGGGGRRG